MGGSFERIRLFDVMGAFDALLVLVWAGASNEAVRLIEQELRAFLFKGAPNEALRLIAQELRDNQAIFAMGGFDEGLTLVWAGASRKPSYLMRRVASM